MFINEKNCISSFKVQRQIVLKDKSTKTDAFEMEFIPIEVGNTFVFAIDNIAVPYSGAKSKIGYNFNDYTVEIKVSYFDGKEKKEQTSAPISLQLFEIGSGTNTYPLKDANSNYLYLSDKFPLNPDFTISGVSVKIIETNTAKVKAERIKSIYDKYADDVKGAANNIVNFYIDNSSDKEEDTGGEK